MSSAPKLQTGGTLGERSVYIERRQDQVAYEQLKTHEYCNILTTRQMGKSSLMMRLRRRLRADGVRTVSIDIAGDIGATADADQFYVGLLDQIAVDFELDLDIGQWWLSDPDKTANQRFVGFFRTILVEQIEQPIVVFLDEIDATLKLPFSDALFTGIRTIYNGRQDYPKTSTLSFCLLGTATPAELIKDRRTTPYNVGSTIELQDFDARRDDLSPLEAQLAAAGRDGKSTLAQILKWTGGHPFLTTAMCRRTIDAEGSQDIDSIIGSAIGSVPAEELRVHFSWINNFLATRLQHGSETFGLYASILSGSKVKAQQTDAHAELRLSGLVKTGDDGYLVVRNKVYLQRFGKEWLAKARPPRVPKAIARAMVGLAAIVLSLLAVLAWQRERSARAHSNVLAQVDRAIEDLPKLNDADDIDAKRAEARGLISSLEPLEQDSRRSRVEKAYQDAWKHLAGPYDLPASNAQREGDFETACVLRVAAAIKDGTGKPEMIESMLQQAPYLKDLRATLRIADTPLRVRAVADGFVAAITARQLVLWAVDNQTAPELVELSRPPSALATSPKGWVSVAAGNTVQFWKGAAPGDASKARRLQPLGTVAIPCASVSAIALGSDADDYVRLAAGCADGKVQVVRVDMRAGDGKSLKTSEPLALSHVEGGRPSSVYAVAFGPGPEELTTASLLMWATVWNLKRKPASNQSLAGDQALDVRIVADRDELVVSGQPLGEQNTSGPFSVLYRRRGGVFSEVARNTANPDAQILAADLSPDGSWVAAATSGSNGRGEVAAWSPDPARKAPSPFAIPKASPRDLVCLSGGVVVAAMDDRTLRVFRIGATEGAAAQAEISQVWREWQARLGLTVDDDGKFATRPLWQDAQPTGFAAIRGPLKD